MPYISPTTNPAEALNGLGSALFPDPSKIAQAQYMGAHGRNMDAQTQELHRQGSARDAMSQTLSAAVANPNQQTIGEAVSTALAAGYKPDEVVRGALAAHQAAGSPGGPRMAQNLSDTIISMVGGTAFSNTQTGQGRELQNQLERSRIAVGPQYQKNAIESAQWNASNRYQLANGNVVALRPGDAIPAGAIPMQDATSRINQQVSSGPLYMQQDRENRKYQDTPEPYIDPEKGTTTYRQPGGPLPPPNTMPAQQGASVLGNTIAAQPALAGQVRETAQWQDKPQPYMRPHDGAMVYRRPGDPLPPSDFLPVEQAGPIAQSQITSEPARIAANAPKPYAVRGNGPTGMVTHYYRPTETPQDGAVPLDPANPVQTGVGAGMFRAPQIDPNAQLAGKDVSIVSPDTGGGGLGGLITGSGGSGAVPVPAAAAPGLPSSSSAQPPSAPPGQQAEPDMFDRLASSAATSAMGTPGAEKPAEDATWSKAIDRLMGEYEAQHNSGGGLNTMFNSRFQLEDRAKQALVARTTQLMRTRGPTFSAFTPALQQAWSELSPTLQRDRTTIGIPNGPSMLRLPAAPRQGGGTGAVPSAGTPTRGPAGTTPTRTEPVPASGNLPKEGPSAPAPASAALSSIIAPDGTQAGPAPAQAAPQLAQAAPAPAQEAPPAPLNPAERQIGQVYTSRVNGRRALWTNQGFVAAP